RIRQSIETQISKPVRYVMLDFTAVTGIDSSAIASLLKLKNFCEKRGVTLVYCGLVDQLYARVLGARLFGPGTRHTAFPTRMEGLNWIEEHLLEQIASGKQQSDSVTFDQWLQRELDCVVQPELIATYFVREEYGGGEILYRQSDPAHSIDFVVTGSLVLMLVHKGGDVRRIRLSTRQTVVGEMGFFRRVPRAITVCAEGPTVIFRLSHERWERLRHEHPEICEALLIFIVRTL